MRHVPSSQLIVDTNQQLLDFGCRGFRSHKLRIIGSRALCLLSLVWIFTGLCLGQKDTNSLLPPRVSSVFPFGGQRGTQSEVEVRGMALDGVYAAWFDGKGLQADILRIEETSVLERVKGTQEESVETMVNPRVQLLHMRVSISGAALSKIHVLRLISSAGISNPLPFVVGSERVVIEANNSHGMSSQAQPVTLPSVIFGRISQTGELDYYSFQTQKGEELVFEVFSRPIGMTLPGKVFIYEQVESGFDAQLGLYEDRGSWFDPDRVRSVGFSDESIFESIAPNPRLSYRFDQDGKYIVEVASGEESLSLERGVGGPDHGYLLRIAPLGTTSLSGEASQKWKKLLARSEWREQIFERQLSPDHLLKLQQRSGQSDPEGRLSRLPSIQEREPNDRVDQAIEIRLPAMVQGTINRSGDSDNYRFEVTEVGQELVFEIETPYLSPPRFNPLMVVMDEEGREVLTNVYLRIGRHPHYRKTVQPKTIHSFERTGEYCLKIQDITHRSGGPEFQYRLLIRPKIPHLGEIEVTEEAESGNSVPIDLINLIPGVPKTLSVVTGLEEGFQSPVSVRAEGLPDAVKLLPALKPDPEATVLLDQGDSWKYVPKKSRGTFMLVADANATPNRTPHWVQFTVGFFSGKSAALKVRQIPLMVLPRLPLNRVGKDVSP